MIDTDDRLFSLPEAVSSIGYQNIYFLKGIGNILAQDHFADIFDKSSGEYTVVGFVSLFFSQFFGYKG